MRPIFEKNLESIENNRPQLYQKLRDIETNRRFEVFVSGKNINILDTKEKIVFYDNPAKEVEHQVEKLDRYREYPFLYLFGIDNGKAIEAILKNDKHKQIVVVEPELELIYIAFNLIDFSKDLKQNRLLILLAEEISYTMLVNLLHVSNAKYYIRVFEFIINSRYSENIYFEKYEEIFKLWIKVLDYVAQANGNDINDTFRGVKQHFKNLNLMLEYPRYQDLLKKSNIDVAVVVSTGPSLDKQIDLLKRYQEKICILSVDASFPILIKNGIKPDFVFSMERDEPTSVFFKKVDVEDQEDIVFLCASLQHKSIYEAIKVKSKVIVMRPFSYKTYLGLHEYGYLCKGMSSANMAYEFATAYGFKEITFIGQDLAFGKDYKTHSSGHVIEEKNPLLEAQIRDNKLIEVEAYGGDGKVLSNIYWNMFRNFLEQHIEENRHIVTTYNSTEGGSRIEGAIEKSFEEFLKKYAKKRKKKVLLDYPTKEEIIIVKEKADRGIKDIIVKLKNLKERVDESFLVMADECKKLENLSKKDALKVFDINKTVYLLELISKIRNEIEQSEIYIKFLSGIIQPLMYSMELEIAEIKVKYVDNPEDNQFKALQWILSHRFWLFSFSGVVENVLHILSDNNE